MCIRDSPELKKVDYAAGDVTQQIGNTVKAACYGYRFQSFGEDKALLAAYNVCAEEVKGEINGNPYQGIVYSAMNDKGEKVGNPVKASRIEMCIRDRGLDALFLLDVKYPVLDIERVEGYRVLVGVGEINPVLRSEERRVGKECRL